MSFPPVILSLILMVGLGTGLDKVILAIVLVDWTRFCRVLRSEVLIVTRRDYVAAARLLGFTHWQTVVREVLPATVPLLIKLLSLEMAIAVVVEAILSFVGLGRRDRLGQVDAGASELPLASAGLRDRGGPPVVRGRGPRARGAGAAARAARPRHHLHPAGAADRAQSGHDHRGAIRRASGADR